MSSFIRSLSDTHDSEYSALLRFRRALRQADILLFDELLAKAESFIPHSSLDGVLPLDSYILAMELVLYREIKKILAENQDPDRKGRVLPFGEGGMAFFSADQIDRFRALGLRVDEEEPSYEPPEDFP